jgi:hypothetical protein
VKRIAWLTAAVLATVAAGCGSPSSSSLYSLQKTTACLRTHDVRLGGQLDFVATTATGGAAKAHFADGNFVTIVFGATLDDADNIAQAYQRFHGPNVGLSDVLRQDRNAVMLWHEHPVDADLATVAGCLK